MPFRGHYLWSIKTMLWVLKKSKNQLCSSHFGELHLTLIFFNKFSHLLTIPRSSLFSLRRSIISLTSWTPHCKRVYFFFWWPFLKCYPFWRLTSVNNIYNIFHLSPTNCFLQYITFLRATRYFNEPTFSSQRPATSNQPSQSVFPNQPRPTFSSYQNLLIRPSVLHKNPNFSPNHHLNISMEMTPALAKITKILTANIPTILTSTNIRTIILIIAKFPAIIRGIWNFNMPKPLFLYMTVQDSTSSWCRNFSFKENTTKNQGFSEKVTIPFLDQR